jgi:GT2 family glycosyltransferase
MQKNKDKQITDLCIVIPTYNRKEHLYNLLIQLSKQTISDTFVKIIVVVDGSTDGTLEMLHNEFRDIYVISEDGTCWYTKSMNKGFEYALKYLDPDFLLTMNDDTEVGLGYISSIINAYSKVEKNSIVGSVSFTNLQPYKIVTSGTCYRNKYLGAIKTYLPLFQPINPNEIKEKIFKSDILPGRGMLIPVEILKKLNRFDEKFKQYHSDSDFCLRASKKGFHVYIAWDAHVFVNEKTTGTGTSFLRESIFKYLSHYFRATSRLYLPSHCILNWRHRPNLLWPINMILFFLVSLKNFFTKEKIN